LQVFNIQNGKIATIILTNLITQCPKVITTQVS
jgi:hypothetical protein